jgi:hypothetical protein
MAKARDVAQHSSVNARLLAMPLFVWGILVLSWAVASAPIALADAPAPASSGGSARVHVRGAARIDAHGSRAPGRLVLRGVLTDDSGAPLADQGVTIAVFTASDPPLPALSGDGAAPGSCSFGARSAPSPYKVEGGKIVAPTDGAGRFCVQATVPTDSYVAHVAWPGSTWLDAAQMDVQVDLGRKPLVLSFTPEPSVVRIDDVLTLDASATFDEEEAAAPAPGLVLTLGDERGARLGTALTNATGRATFTVDPARLASPPGNGELRLAFDGNSEVGKALHVAHVERRSRVILQAPEATEDTLPASDAEDATFTISLRTPSGAVVPTGSVEALVGATVVGAAPVDSGTARLVVNVPGAPEQTTVHLRIRYAPDAPWYTPGDELSLSMPVRVPGPWRTLAILLAGLVVIAWLVIGRTSRGRGPYTVDDEPASIPSQGEARIDVIRSVKTSRAGWTGRVIDAHDETPVANAMVSVHRPSFQGVSVVATAQANQAGRFELRCEDVQSGDMLVLEAPLHAVLRKPVPPYGEIQIALVLRRRKLLARLVAWARTKGKPFDQNPEPTPGHVKRAAGADRSAAEWADAVERAAFGPADVDEQVEHAVARLEPRAPTAPHPPHAPEVRDARAPRGPR